MANNHGHGSQGAIEMGTHADPTGATSPLVLTTYLTGIERSESVDVAEDTNMAPTGKAKTFLYGLNGGTMNLPCEPDKQGVLAIAVQAIVDNQDVVTIYDYPFGKVSGYLRFSQQVLITNPLSMSNSLNGIVTGTLAFQRTGPRVVEVYTP